MKTNKPRILNGLLIVLATLPFLFTSCTEDDYDLRDEITGQYSYVLKMYVDDGKDLVYVGDQNDNYDIEGTMRVVKNSGDLGVLDFFDGNILMFQGFNIKDAGNAIVFDIPDQDGWIGPTKVLIAGYHYWDVEDKSYDGAFLVEDKSIEIAFTARIQNVDTGLVMVLTAYR